VTSRSTFTYPDDASRFPSSTQRILELADHLGWSFHWLGNGHRLVGITSPDRVKTITIPSTNLNYDRTRSTLLQIRRYTPDVEKFDAWVDDQTRIKGGLRFTLPDTAEQVRPARRSRVRAPEPETAVAAALREAQERAAAAVAAGEEERARGELHPLDETAPSSGHGTVVSETPWMIRKDGVEGARGRMYESHNVTKRVWSDGFEDYGCNFCEYDSDNPRSVSMHANRRKDHPKREGRPEIREVAEYHESGIKHGESTVRRLNADLLHALDGVEGWQSMDRETLARTLAERIIENRPDRAPAEPLTPEQIIERIVLMVDRGRLAEMHQQVETLAAEVRKRAMEAAAANVLAAEATAEAERLREERRVLRDLLSEDRSAS
jgi:hypothetical protein